MIYNTVTYEKKNKVAKILLNRPDKLNAISVQMRAELHSVLSSAAIESSVRVIVISGRGRAFCAGSDIGEIASGRLGRDAAGAVMMRQVLKGIETCPKPVIAAVNGFAMGAGLELAMACDLRIAAEPAQFGLTEVNLGAIPGYGGTQRLPRLVGVAKAKEMVLLGQRISAEEAYRVGLVNRVVAADNLWDSVDQIVNILLEKAPVALSAAKAAINKVWESTDLDSGLIWERDLANICAETADRAEGMKAFLEGRKPKFKGR